MPSDSPRILELRRRVETDPASIAFAQLAEEYRRAGRYHDAIACCRTGLTRHPGYLSARVTLGRALVESGSPDEAAREFALVLGSAPDNLAAIRGMAETHQRSGRLEQALDYYNQARRLARHDPELEETVAQIGRQLRADGSRTRPAGLSFEETESELLSAFNRFQATAPVAPSAPVAPGAPGGAPGGAPVPTDFDALLQTLGAPDAAPPPVMDLLLGQPSSTAEPPPRAVFDGARDLPAVTDEATDDPFAALERELRAFTGPPPDDRRGAANGDPSDARVARGDASLPAALTPDLIQVTESMPAPRVAETAERGGAAWTEEDEILQELEAWLAALQADRDSPIAQDP